MEVRLYGENSGEQYPQARFLFELATSRIFNGLVPLDMAARDTQTAISPATNEQLLVFDEYNGYADCRISVLNPSTRRAFPANQIAVSEVLQRRRTVRTEFEDGWAVHGSAALVVNVRQTLSMLLFATSLLGRSSIGSRSARRAISRSMPPKITT